MVMPGDEVAVAEEYMASDGTYESEGKILASLAGTLTLDEDRMLASVKPANPVAELRNGDSVFCRITDVRSAMAVCEVLALESRDRGITGETSATIHVSKLSSDYVQDVGREYRPGDLIRAKVIQVKPSVQLSTQEGHYGVVKAVCRQCRSPLSRDGKALRCPMCERTETRKLADDFDSVEPAL